MSQSRACVLLLLSITLASIQTAAAAQPPPPKGEPESTALPDYSTLDLKGNGHTQDSFSLAVQAAAGLLGMDADYQAIYCLSGNAFAPAIDRGEDCTAWWHVQGWQADEAMDTVAAALGLHAARLELPPNGFSAADSQDEFARKALIARKGCAAIVRSEMDDGSVVMTDGGWRIQMQEGFTPWCWWGIVTGATEDGDLRGACLGAHPGKALGFRDRPLDYLGGSWAISPGEATLGADQVDAAVLEQAVARIRGTGPYAATERPAYGLDAMDEWIAQMAELPFCTACAHAGPPGMAGCAVNNAQTSLAGATAAAAYLRERAPSFDAGAQVHVQAAAGHYDRISELLGPATWGLYRGILDDPEQQRAHADTVLAPVRGELVAAVEEMEKALAAMGETVSQSAR